MGCSRVLLVSPSLPGGQSGARAGLPPSQEALTLRYLDCPSLLSRSSHTQHAPAWAVLPWRSRQKAWSAALHVTPVDPRDYVLGR